MKRFRKSVLLIVALFSLAFTYTFDLFSDLGLTKEDADATIESNFHIGGLGFLVTNEMRKMPPAMRTKIVSAMGEYMKSRIATEEFAQNYRQVREEGKPILTTPLNLIEDPAERAEMTKQYNTDLKEFEKNYPPTVNGLVKRRLQQFLELTEGMDFNAKLVKRGKFYYFENPALEEKDAEWKLMFRCGKDVILPAREYAKQWMASRK